MLRRLVPVVAVGAVVAWAGCPPPPGDGPFVLPPGDGDGDLDVEDVPFGLDERPPNPTCLARPRPVRGGTYALQPAFDALRFTKPVALLQAPGDDRWYLLEQTGRVLRFPDRPDVTADEVEVFADLTALVDATAVEAGLLGLAFHPDYESNGLVFVSYNIREDDRIHSQVARFLRTPDDTLSAAPDRVLLTFPQPWANHNGGDAKFGPDGYLYLSFGDGGSGGDPQGNGQNPMTWFGSLLRLDVDGAAPYAIPPDNPFASGGGGLPEIYAWGFRNVWRFSFDRATGELWAGDVGQGTWEEVDLVDRGGNYGWNLFEGTHCFTQGACDPAGLIDPVVEYHHDEGRSVTGGYVYRGTELTDLIGTYLYADYQFGTMWALRFDDVTGEPQPEVIVDSNILIASFGEAHDGRLFVVGYSTGGSGRLYQLVRQDDPPEDTFPRLLSETGCFDPAQPGRPVAGAIPYGVNVTLWSDGATKDRWLALPDGTAATLDERGHVDFPVGTVLIKSFLLEDRRVETRLLMRHDDGEWGGYSYAWNEEQTDAELLPAGETRVVGGQLWSFPSRRECLACHTEVAGRSLGPTLAQLDGLFIYPGARRAPQLDTLVHLGVLAEEPPEHAVHPNLWDDKVSVQDRARAYLDVNCAHCHQPGGTGQGNLDLRASTPLQDARLCNEPAQEADLGIPGGYLFTPGDPARSVLSERMHRTDVYRMPDLGSFLVDPVGTALVDEWIRTTPACP